MVLSRTTTPSREESPLTAELPLLPEFLETAGIIRFSETVAYVPWNGLNLCVAGIIIVTSFFAGCCFHKRPQMCPLGSTAALSDCCGIDARFCRECVAIGLDHCRYQQLGLLCYVTDASLFSFRCTLCLLLAAVARFSEQLFFVFISVLLLRRFSLIKTEIRTAKVFVHVVQGTGLSGTGLRCDLILLRKVVTYVSAFRRQRCVTPHCG